MPIRNLILVPVLAALVAPAICQTMSSDPAIPTLQPVVAPAAPQAVVPALIPFSGVALAADGKPLAGETEIMFLIYKEQQGGEPLWDETQTVLLDTAGHYKVQLGAATDAGLPMELFAAGDARWLEVQVAGQWPEPRIMLISVPYALKAADAETLGGLPASAFALAPAAGAAAAETARAAAAVVPASSPASSNVTTSGGAVGTIPMFSTSTDIENSAITQTVFASGTEVGIGTFHAPVTLNVNQNAVQIGSTRVGGLPYGTITMQGGLPVLHQCCRSLLWNIFVGGAGNLSLDNIGARNSALGYGALAAIDGRSAPEHGDTAVGFWALKGNTNGSENSALGDSAGLTTVQANQNVTGSKNTFLGYASGPGTPTQLTNATAVGSNAVVSEDNALVLGSIDGVNGAKANTKVGIGTTKPATTLDVEAPVGTVPTIRFGSLKIPAVFAVNGDTFLGGALAVGEGTKVMSVAHDGIITFAPGQTFPSAGTITGVTTSSPLTGHGTTGSVALGLNTSALENTLNGTYAQLGAANTFPMYQQMLAGLSVTGQLSAGNVTAGESYSGGNAITGANAATSGYSNGGMFTSASPGGAAVVGQNASGGPAGLFIGPVNLEPNFVATSSNPQNSPPLSLRAQGYSSQSGGQLVNQTFQWEAVPVPGTNNTASPSTTLNLLYGSGTNAAPATPAATGFSINSDGTLNFAGNQSFPITGTGGGTITGITTSGPLTGSGTSGSVALGLNTSALETTLNQNYAQLLAENLFVGYQQVQGGMSVTGALSTGGVTSTVSGSNAVYGQSLATTGTSNGGYFSTTSPAGTGVVGVNSAGGYAGYFQGNVAVTGSAATGQLAIGGDTPMSHNPHMVFSGYLLGDLSGGGFGLLGGFFIPDQNITITRISASVQSPGTGCSTDATVDIYSNSATGPIASLNIGQDQGMDDSGPLNPPVNVAAGTQLTIGSVGASGCNLTGGSPNNVFVNVQYVMQ
ncbi:MAG: hypothetical protein WBX09_01575 [Terracidiphilus sp.]